MNLRPADFKSAASAISPPPRTPIVNGFARLSRPNFTAEAAETAEDIRVFSAFSARSAVKWPFQSLIIEVVEKAPSSLWVFLSEAKNLSFRIVEMLRLRLSMTYWGFFNTLIIEI
jgi:hypothetical protein